MKRNLLTVALVLMAAGLADARGIVIPTEKSIPPLAMLNHKVEVVIDSQVAVTRLEQTFRNHTSRDLEATYIFPVPKGASVQEFAMWVGGKKVKGELVEAARAREIYTSIVRQTQDPGLLEYLGNDLLQMKIFPIPAKGDQKIEVSFTSIANRDKDLIEYVYPLKTDGKATSTLEEFSMKIRLKSQTPIVNIYSPTHELSISRTGDKEALVSFEKNQARLDRDFTLYYTTDAKQDVGLTALMHRPISDKDGYFMMLISPRYELSKNMVVPRDLVFVIDTSGSMREDGKMEQAKKALKYCLAGLNEQDRFAVIHFGTTVNQYGDGLTPVNAEQMELVKKWIDNLEPNGGTAMDDALQAALDLKTKDNSRTFTVLLLTDGKPTLGVTKPDQILGNVAKKNSANTRIFCFGVGDDMNAALLDQLADQTRAASMFVRSDQLGDMEMRMSSFYDKIARPALANLKLTFGKDVTVSEVYPPKLPDLFHGSQLVVMGKYSGSGPVAVKLTGTLGKESREFVFETDFRPKAVDKPFVEELWARRKVGYLLEQIRINGENQELVGEVTALAKKYGIATPYTSYLIVPDAPLPVAGGKGKDLPANPAVPPTVLAPGGAGQAPKPVAGFAKDVQAKPGDLAKNRNWYEDRIIEELDKKGDAKTKEEKELAERYNAKKAYDEACRKLQDGKLRDVQIDRLGVDLSCEMNNLKNQTRVVQTAYRNIANRNCMEIGGVWIDEGFNEKTKTVVVKAQSDAYFRLLEKRPELKELFQLGNYLVWIAPNGEALVIDAHHGQEKIDDEQITALFTPPK